MTLKLSQITGNDGGVVWETISSNATAESGKGYMVDCSGSGITVTLPSSPSVGAQVNIKDYTGNASTNNITIDNNGNNIEGSASNYIVSENNRVVELVYVGGTRGWVDTFNQFGKTTISSSSPSGGAHGDIWYQV